MNDTRRSRLRANGKSPSFLAAMSLLRKEASEATTIRYAIGEREKGQWTHLYHCHLDGAALTFDWELPTLHVCPVCGEEHRGEPFDSCWTSSAHNRIGRAVYFAALLYAFEPDEELLNLAKGFLLGYSEHYEAYKVHGDIPYNGPGKLFAQTLDEAHWILDLAAGFHLLRDALSPEEDQRICSGLLAPCAEFLIAHKERQIHNHAVLITSAIGVLGILLGDEAVIEAGLDGEYGLRDQMDRGILGDGFWYEGSVHYHVYALKALIGFALIAEGTKWDLWRNPALKAMFDYPLKIILPGGYMPSLNDGGPLERMDSYAPYYEVALDIYGDETYRSFLQTVYTGCAAEPIDAREEPAERTSIYALLFGRELTASADRPPSLQGLIRQNYSLPISGLSQIRHPSGWYALVKHSIFGGEHDHMDRLGLSLGCGAIPVMTDPGTTAYGVPAHYGWFKHTLAHNTLSLGGSDQPPRDGRLVQAAQKRWGTLLEAAVDWGGDDFRMKGRIILPEALRPWDEQLYEGAAFRRILALAGDYVLDITRAQVPQPRDICLSNHLSGEWIGTDDGWKPAIDGLGRIDLRWLNEYRGRAAEPCEVFRYQIRDGGILKHLSWCSAPSDLLAAVTPDNPLANARATLIRRAKETNDVVFVQVLYFGHENNSGVIPESRSKQDQLVATEGPDGTWLIAFQTMDGMQRFSLDWRNEGARLEKLDENDA
ncbi:heparinase II/III domain-containing protein [Paenibacillus beijingensis]|uniref:heparinase II/III domain-containing protein n=1 Tax=Paenibacillus beijingensis TaxID=1126833 RepID=UPI0009E5835B|nr:heparinase II/III family protein [Paenibacillus beijingensis]